MTHTISNSDDVIDSRDIIARIKELEDEREALVDAVAESEAAHDAALNGAPDADTDLASKFEERQAALAEWDESDEADELKALKAIDDDAPGDDWSHGATLIRESHFVEYCQELVQDIGDLPKNIPGYLVIDWEATAHNLRHDYTEVDYDGVAYLVR